MRTLIILILLSSCSQKAWIKRGTAKGWLTATSDTITIRDTIRGWQYDTIVQYDTNSITDTLIVSNGKDSIVTIVKWKERTIRQIKTEKDTIVENKVITNYKTIEKKPKWYQNFSFGMGMGVLVSLISLWLLILFFKSFSKSDTTTH